MAVRVAGLVLVDIEVAQVRHHTGSDALRVTLTVVANLGALGWLSARLRGVQVDVAALAVMAAAGGLLAALQHGSAALAFPAVAVAQSVADDSALAALAVGAVALVAIEVGVLWADLSAGAALGYAAILLGCTLVGVTRRQYVAQARAATALLAQTLETEAVGQRAAALDERARIAREIHDVLAHALGGLAVQLEAAEILLAERGDVAGALERIRGSRRTAREGLEEARRAVAALRTDAPPLPEALAGLVESHRAQGAQGDLVIEGAARELSPEVSLALMRTVQEALTNARRHAPGAHVRVALVYAPDHASVTVTNDAATGPGPVDSGTPTGGYGLAGMRERLELAGGRLAAGPTPDGWAVSAQIPV